MSISIISTYRLSVLLVIAQFLFYKYIIFFVSIIFFRNFIKHIFFIILILMCFNFHHIKMIFNTFGYCKKFQKLQKNLQLVFWGSRSDIEVLCWLWIAINDYLRMTIIKPFYPQLLSLMNHIRFCLQFFLIQMNCQKIFENQKSDYLWENCSRINHQNCFIFIPSHITLQITFSIIICHYEFNSHSFVIKSI